MKKIIYFKLAQEKTEKKKNNRKTAAKNISKLIWYLILPTLVIDDL